jgi:hypothetical protein
LAGPFVNVTVMGKLAKYVECSGATAGIAPTLKFAEASFLYPSFSRK